MSTILLMLLKIKTKLHNLFLDLILGNIFVIFFFNLIIYVINKLKSSEMREKIERETKGKRGPYGFFKRREMHTRQGGKGMCIILIRLPSPSSSLTFKMR